MVAALALLALGTSFDFELAGGIAHSLQASRPDDEYPPAKPALQARVAVNVLPELAFGAMFLAITGGEAPNSVGCCGPNSGNQAFKATAALFTLRARSTELPVWAELG